ncbi:DUF2800 domain-containing protein [Methylobacterium brachiatum]|uniref:DUF2800 domain-containing protein n=1 Tax=Methylobacterium brachiatum TaxID=269660 RepID=UPI0008E6E4A4|nr:DUF2800 domain-containing protein [Methylobacterium brachiatum]SFJ68932.1 Protein of unknown function [Methylobacterium brachiatum]
MPGDHARLSPSGSSIWMNCPGQPQLATGLERRGSVHAERGTAAHSVLEWCLKHKREAAYYTDRSIYVEGRKEGALTLGEDDLAAVQMAVDWIREQIAPEDEVATEERLRYSDDLWGTADVRRYRPSTGELLIVDYKHGSGVAVDATGNPQGMIYALMAAKGLGNRGVSSVRFVIVQPRCFHPAGPIREFTVDGIDMLDWEDRIVQAVQATQRFKSRAEVLLPVAGENDPLRPGSHCRWCPAAGICPAIKREAEAEVQRTFEPAAYDPDDLAATLGKLDRIEAWAKAVREFAYSEAERGARIPGFKLAPKRPVRRWKDSGQVVDALGLYGLESEDLYERAFRSPAQVETLLEPAMPGGTKKARLVAAKALLAGMIEAVSNGHSLVPENDPRPPLRGDAADDFTAAI